MLRAASIVLVSNSISLASIFCRGDIGFTNPYSIINCFGCPDIMARPGSGRAGSPWQAAAAEVLQPTRPERPRGPEPEQDVASLQAQLAALLRETAPPGAAADDFDAGLDEFRPATSTSGEWSPADVSRRVDKGDARPGGAFDKHINPGGAFAGFRFDDDPVFSALKESEKDYDWLLLSERAQRSRGDRARRDRSPPREPALLFSHAREGAAPARPLTVSVGIGTDGPALEVPREAYEEMADRVEELRAELEASPADADLREELADLRSRLDDAVPVDAKLRGKRLFRAAAIAVLFFPAIPRLAVRRRRRRTRERDAARCEDLDDDDDAIHQDDHAHAAFCCSFDTPWARLLGLSGQTSC